MSVRRVLVVDDDVDIRTLAVMSLERVGGHEVASVGSGEECLAELVEHRPDVVVLDVMMPVMDGPMTLAAIRANPATADVPVVFLTASVLPPELAMLNSFDVAGVLRKPFDPMDLADSLGRLLQW